MMLQGHFIDVTLDNAYRSDSYWLYNSWAWMRGLTAPIFFTVTGLVFVYLLTAKKTDTIFKHQRWRKGIRRGVMLVGIGYILRTNLPSLMSLHFGDWSFQTDVLHCIGIALLFLCALYALSKQSHQIMGGLLLLSGLLIFLTEPIYSTLDTSSLALPLRHYINKQYGAIFSPLPWLGYSALGGLVGLSLRHLSRRHINLHLPIVLIFIGLMLQFWSSYGLMMLHHWSEQEVFRTIAYNNNSFLRFSQCLMAIGAFILLLGRAKSLPDWLQKTGSETLTIYAAHYVILYGTWFSLGINTYLAASLSPLSAVSGAVVFVLSGILLAVNIEAMRQKAGYYRLINLPTRIASALR